MIRAYPFRRARGGRPIVVGHRGVRREGGPTENTVEAFLAAADEGARAVELDVRVDGSGAAVVLHDPTLDRVTAGADDRSVAALSSAELDTVRLAAGERVPTLAQALEACRARDVAVNVEMKRDVPSRPAVVRATANLLSSWDPKHGVVVSSFDPAMLAAFGALAPGVPRALLIHRTPWHPLAAFVSRPLGFEAVHVERTIASARFVHSVRARGLVVLVWTVNRAGEARDLAELGVDGLITDVPGDVLDALRT